MSVIGRARPDALPADVAENGGKFNLSPRAAVRTAAPDIR
jgi:hypothetical protein